MVFALRVLALPAKFVGRGLRGAARGSAHVIYGAARGAYGAGRGAFRATRATTTLIRELGQKASGVQQRMRAIDKKINGIEGRRMMRRVGNDAKRLAIQATPIGQRRSRNKQRLRGSWHISVEVVIEIAYFD